MPIHKPVKTTPENLDAIAVELQRCAAEIQGVAETIKSMGFGELAVVNFGQLKNAVRFANNYVSAAKDAIWDAREKRGDFGTASNGDGHTPRKRAAKKK